MTLSFEHIFRPAARSGAPVLLLLHGTGGDEHDLLPLGALLDASAALLSVRGQVVENGMPRFFRRLAPGVLDEDDLRTRAAELGEFIVEASRTYDFDVSSVVAVGFSNGANMAAGIMWDAPSILRRAVLVRPMLPYRERLPGALNGCEAIVLAGNADQMTPRESVNTLVERMRAAGANVTVEWLNAGHNLTQEDVDKARQWVVGSLGK